jgi:hypothetical protein
MKVNIRRSVSGRDWTNTPIQITSLRYDKLMCSIPECGKKVLARGYCKSHYEKWRTYGDALAGRTNKQRSKCKLKGCEERPYRWGLCGPHFKEAFAAAKPPRQRKPRAPETKPRRPKGTGYLRADGYLQLGGKHGHPLADSRGIVYVHRMVLFDKIGPGEHRCHWCGTPISWMVAGAGADGALIADHVDFDPSNNDPGNLVPSCNLCNSQRHRPQKSRPV